MDECKVANDNKVILGLNMYEYEYSLIAIGWGHTPQAWYKTCEQKNTLFSQTNL